MSLPVDIYIRVSRRGGREDEKFHSPAEQEQIARAYAKQRRLRVGVVLAPDIDRSGGTVNREGLQQALSRIRTGASQGFVVAWIDRFSRDAAQAYDLLREIEDAGGRVYAPEAPEDVSSPEGELQLGMFLLIAQYQRKRARAGFARAKERAILNGIPVGPVPVGYRRREDRRLEVDPETAPVVRELFERWVTGEGRNRLAALLDERAPQKDRKWSRQVVPAIIHNRLYATGRLEYGGVVSEVEAGALVDEPLWHAAQAARPGARPKRNPESPWLLTGMAVCGTCGYNLTPTTTRAGGPKRYRYYRCTNRACTARRGASAPRLEDFVRDTAFLLLGAKIQERATTPDLAPLDNAVALAERRLEQVLAPDARDALGDLWAADVKARRTERDAAMARLGEARQHAGTADAEIIDLRERWNDMTPVERREALGVYLIERVIVHGATPVEWEVMFK
jgi:site-specific DNA recombinase